MESQAIEVDLEKVLDMLEKECTGYKQRWLRLRELLKLQKAAQQADTADWHVCECKFIESEIGGYCHIHGYIPPAANPQ